MQQISNVKEGDEFDFGTSTLSEQEIIAFGKQFDPLLFHVDKEAAEQSHFKGLIASGPHFFTKIHRDCWIPIFGHSVLAGLEINNWKFLQPIYADMPIHSKAIVKSIKKNAEKQHAVIIWQYQFTNEEKGEIQKVEATVLHSLS